MGLDVLISRYKSLLITCFQAVVKLGSLYFLLPSCSCIPLTRASISGNSSASACLVTFSSCSFCAVAVAIAFPALGASNFLAVFSAILFILFARVAIALMASWAVPPLTIVLTAAPTKLSLDDSSLTISSLRDLAALLADLTADLIS